MKKLLFIPLLMLIITSCNQTSNSEITSSSVYVTSFNNSSTSITSNEKTSSIKESSTSNSKSSSSYIDPNHEHNYVLVDSKEPTWEIDGYKEYKCLICSNTYKDTIETYYGEKYEIIKSPNCIKAGILRFYSDLNEKYLDVEIAATPHILKDNKCIECKKEFINYGIDELNIYHNDYAKKHFESLIDHEKYISLYTKIDNLVRSFFVNNYELNDSIIGKIDIGSLDATEAVSVWKLYRYDHPLYYFMSNTVAFDENNIVIMVSEDYIDVTKRIEIIKDLYINLSTISTYTNFANNDYNKITKLVHKIIEKVNYLYDENYLPSEESYAHNILGVMNSLGAVCEGYANTVSIILNMLKIKNILVSGMSMGQLHIWNLVNLENEYYWLDTTWGDFNSREELKGLENNYTFFLMSDNGFLDSHTYETNENFGVNYLYDIPDRAEIDYETRFDKTLETEDFNFKVLGEADLEVKDIKKGGDVRIPNFVNKDGIKYRVVSIDWPNYLEEVTSLYFPETMLNIGDMLTGDENCKVTEFKVSTHNESFTAVDGALFTKSLYTFISYPIGNPRKEYKLPDEVRCMGHCSLFSPYPTALEKFIFNKDLELIGVPNWGVGFLNETLKGGIINIVEGEFDHFNKAMSGKKEIEIPEDSAVFSKYKGAIYGGLNGEKTTLYYINDETCTSFVILKETLYFDHITNLTSPFSVCETLENLSVEEGHPTLYSESNVVYDKKTNTALFTATNIKELTFKEGTTSLREGLCMLNYNLEKLTLPNSLKTIDSYTFYSCRNLVEIDFGGVETILTGAFVYCMSLENIIFPASMKKISTEAFDWTPKLNATFLDPYNWALVFPNGKVRFRFDVIDYGSVYTKITSTYAWLIKEELLNA